MRLTAKILSWLLIAIAVVMVMFTSLAIYMLQKNLEEEALRSHKLIYSLFLPTVTRYLWEFDITGIKETLTNIIENNYGNKIYIYDGDATLVTSLYKDPSTGKISSSKEIDKSKQNNEIITKQIIEDLEKKNLKNEEFFIFQEDIAKDTSRIIGSMLHKKGTSTTQSIIGYFVLDYSTGNIAAAVNSMIRGVIILSVCITFMLVVSIGLLLRKTLISYILKLNQASINVSRGRYKQISIPQRSKDEMVELVKNFNIMTQQIQINQENLKILAEEGIKISTSFNINNLAKQVGDSLKRLSKDNLNTEFYISNLLMKSHQKDGFYEILEPEKNAYINKDDEKILPDGKKRFYIKDSSGNTCIILQINELMKEHIYSYAASESLYNAIMALQISISNALDNIRFIAEQKEQQRLISEQETARLVQNNLMPKSDFRKIGQFELANHFEAADECAGDWWNYYILPNDKLLLLLGDVTGHGTASALLTAVVKGYCDSIHTQPHITTREILNQLDSVVRESGDGNKVMTMFAAVLDPQNGIIEFSNAAHNFPMVIKRKNDIYLVEKLIAQGRPLGIEIFTSLGKENEYSYDQKQVKLESGDILFIFSDGLIEAPRQDGEEFGERRLKKTLSSLANKNVIAIKNDIIKEFREFTSSNKLHDDVTFLVCKYIHSA